MKKILFVCFLGLTACGDEKDETSVEQGVPVSGLFCMDRCIADNVDQTTAGLQVVENICRGAFSQPESCCKFKDFPNYGECK